MNTQPRYVCVLPALAALLLAACTQETSPPAQGVIALSDQFSSDFALIDQNGALLRDEDLKGKAAIVYFGFATCPDVCPLALGRVSAALNELTPKEREKVMALFITVDPDRDTPEALKKFLAFDDRIIGLTGDRQAVDAAMKGFKVYAEAETLPDSALGYTMQHSSIFYLIDRKGRLGVALEDTMEPAAIAREIRRAL